MVWVGITFLQAIDAEVKRVFPDSRDKGTLRDLLRYDETTQDEWKRATGGGEESAFSVTRRLLHEDAVAVVHACVLDGAIPRSSERMLLGLSQL